MWTPDTDTAPAPENPYPFKLADTISTGHTANIFSSKFLPGASHMTIASCAGDSQILVYDVERLDRLIAGGLRSRLGELNGMNGPGVRRLLCHRDRVKRISTEVGHSSYRNASTTSNDVIDRTTRMSFLRSQKTELSVNMIFGRHTIAAPVVRHH